MVKVIIIGATGKSGSRIQNELLSRGHTVTSVARDPSKVAPAANLTVVQGNITDDLVALIAGHDVVVNAYAPPFDAVQELVDFTRRLAEAAKVTGTRLIMVGGAGGLQVADGTLVINQPWFPEAWNGIAQAHIDALEVLRASGANWTTLTPPTMFNPGERTGKFRLDLEKLVATESGSSISMEDFAVALVDEIENPKHERLRFTIGY